MRTATGGGPGARRRSAFCSVVAAALIASAACSSGSAGEAPFTTAFPSDINAAQPTFLGSATAAGDKVLTGSIARPALTAEGEAVRVQLAGASVTATVTGPEVPGEGLPKVTDTTTCTWTVTLSAATAEVPIRLADFSASDHLGAVSPMALAPGQPAPPAVLAPGRTVTFGVRAVMHTGEGLMRWAPGGSDLVASWDFVVEND